MDLLRLALCLAGACSALASSACRSDGEASCREGEDPTTLMQLKSKVQQGRTLISMDPKAERLERLKPVFWLHIGKTGVSWANVLLLHKGLCPLLPTDFNVSTQTAEALGHHEEYCPNSFSEYTQWHRALGDIYPEVKHHVVSLFRQPEQRLISHYQMMLSYGNVKEEDYPLLEFAKVNAGLQFQMIMRPTLRGHDLATDGTWADDVPPSPANVALALSHLREGFAFVGLTEEWDLSVCLFHAKFGAECLADDFVDVHLGDARNSSSELYDTAGLHGWVDTVDREIYAEASQIFLEDMQRFSVSVESCAQWCWAGGISETHSAGQPKA